MGFASLPCLFRLRLSAPAWGFFGSEFFADVKTCTDKRISFGVIKCFSKFAEVFEISSFRVDPVGIEFYSVNAGWESVRRVSSTPKLSPCWLALPTAAEVALTRWTTSWTWTTPPQVPHAQSLSPSQGSTGSTGPPHLPVTPHIQTIIERESLTRFNRGESGTNWSIFFHDVSASCLQLFIQSPFCDLQKTMQQYKIVTFF